MDESQDSAAFTAECVTVDPSRAEYVQQVLSQRAKPWRAAAAKNFNFGADQRMYLVPPSGRATVLLRPATAYHHHHLTGIRRLPT